MTRIERQRKRRSLARRLRERFGEDEGAAMFENIRRPSGRLRDGAAFDGAGQVVPTVGHEGAVEVVDYGTHDQHHPVVEAPADLLNFVLSGGPMTPSAIARRAAATASLIVAAQVTVERAARIARCDAATISRIRKNAKRHFARKAA
ncbi:MAG: hypothetical protein IAE97_10535 [Chthoniobacterales bacterium]|nr:hypothetical protein [Chthoniobacterales bacterium]